MQSDLKHPLARIPDTTTSMMIGKSKEVPNAMMKRRSVIGSQMTSRAALMEEIDKKRKKVVSH